jgi:hypothetical protein
LVAVLRRRVRSSRRETLAWKGDGNRAVGLGSFEDLVRWREQTPAPLITLIRSVDRSGPTARMSSSSFQISQFLSQDELDGITLVAFAPMSAYVRLVDATREGYSVVSAPLRPRAADAVLGDLWARGARSGHHADAG